MVSEFRWADGQLMSSAASDPLGQARLTSFVPRLKALVPSANATVGVKSGVELVLGIAGRVHHDLLAHSTLFAPV